MQLASHSLKGNALSGEGTGRSKVVRSWRSCLWSLQGLDRVEEVVFPHPHPKPTRLLDPTGWYIWVSR